MDHSAREWIERLGMERHPEGGYYCETYRSQITLEGELISARFAGPHALSTAIYFLLEGRDFSSFHSLQADELWHFYSGSALTLHLLSEGDGYRCIHLGSHAQAGEVFQAMVPAATWFAATVDDSAPYSLVGCTMSPGFEFRDFELARRRELLEIFPDHRRLIERLTRR